MTTIDTLPLDTLSPLHLDRRPVLAHPMGAGATAALPVTDAGPVGSRALALTQKPLAWALRRWYDVQLHDVALVPQSGPCIIAANHVGTLDGPLAVLAAPRPTYALAKNELFAGPVGRALALGGQIPLHRDYADFPALRRAVQILRAGNALAIFPEGKRDDGTCRVIQGGVAYLALVTGAPVVPCAFLGTRLPAGGRTSLPPRGSALHVVYGKSLSIPAVPWPRRRDQVASATEVIRRRLAAHVAEAVERTGVELPGPVIE